MTLSVTEMFLFSLQCGLRRGKVLVVVPWVLLNLGCRYINPPVERFGELLEGVRQLVPDVIPGLLGHGRHRGDRVVYVHHRG